MRLTKNMHLRGKHNGMNGNRKGAKELVQSVPTMEENCMKSVFLVSLSFPMTGGLHFLLLIVYSKVWHTSGVC